ncbi:hypothetical protein [Flavobacterium anhuiense]|uniref:hypothetical protein n=1 Tax=Flavobacterium anhuiense TaxID=459526 RepID=UPI003D958BEE
MTKQEAIVNISTILNRKSSLDSETIFFESKKHDDLLDLILRYIQNSSALIGAPKIFKTQALNDHGVDLIVEYPNKCKIGIQIKSHYDVSEKDFAMKVKAQFAESQFHALDKWYLMICSPLQETGGTNYSSKISHLINELSGYKTSYHVVYNPQQMANILSGGIMPESEFRSIKNQYYFEETNWTELFKVLGSSPKTKSYLDAVSDSGKGAITAGLYNKYLDMKTEEEKQSSIDDLKNLLDLLNEIPKKTREFLWLCIAKGKDIKMGLSYVIAVLCHDIENTLHIDNTIVRKEIGILKSHHLAYIDDLKGDNTNYSIVIQNANPNYNILLTIKQFCSEYKIDLKSIIVDLDFSLFDE